MINRKSFMIVEKWIFITFKINFFGHVTLANSDSDYSRGIY